MGHLIFRFVLTSLGITLAFLIEDSEGKAVRKRWINPTEDLDSYEEGGGYIYPNDLEGEENEASSNLDRRGTGLDKENLEFPPFPGDDYDRLGLEESEDEDKEPEVELARDYTTTTMPAPSPWYKKIHKFFKNVSNSVRGRRRDY